MSAYDPKRTVSSGLEGAMRRRDFITLIGTAAAARPVAAHAQQWTMPVVDVLSPATSEADANRMNAIRGGSQGRRLHRGRERDDRVSLG